MYAIIQSGARQFRVEKGDVIAVDLLEGKAGEAIEFKDVLFIGDGKGVAKVGTPLVKGSKVMGEYLGVIKGPKITSVKYKYRKNQYRKFGHRQKYGQVKITEITG